jgi:transposase, IS5 family
MKSQQSPQCNLFKVILDQICDSKHPLYRLANTVNWQAFEEMFGNYYCDNNGRPAKPIRLMVGLHYLKAMYGVSDEGVVEKWVENPYWQYFCGEKEFQHDFPLEPTSLVKWRKRIKNEGLESLLSETISSGLKLKVIKKNDVKREGVEKNKDLPW